jgi:hypothetical protein
VKIIAIWSRDKIAPKAKSIFILTSDGQFGEFEPETKYMGRDEDNIIILGETGDFEFYSEEPLKGNKWDFKQANYFIKHFGGQLEKDFREVK